MEDDYLSHYGVKGMKWGKRKSLPTSSIRSNLNSTKAQYKSAKKAFNKSFHDAYNHAYQAYSPFKKRRQANADRWERANADSEKVERRKKHTNRLKQNEKTH